MTGRRLVLASLMALSFGAASMPVVSAEIVVPRLSDEGCEAQNPLRPTCSFTVTHTSTTPVTGAGGVGDWVVIVERGSHKFRVRSLPDGRLAFIEISYKIGDEVTAKALSPGSGLTAGHFDP